MTVRRLSPLVESVRARRGRAAAGAGAGWTAVGRQLQRTDGVPLRRRHSAARRAATRAAAATTAAARTSSSSPAGAGAGMGYGGGSLFGTLFVLAAVGVGAAMVMRAVRARTPGAAAAWQPVGDAGRRRGGRGAGPRLPLQAAARARALGARHPGPTGGFRRQGRHRQRGGAGVAAAADRRSSCCATRTRSATRPPTGAAR